MLFLAPALCVSLQSLPAQSGLQVYPVEMAAEFNAVPGKLVVLEDELVFVDDQRPQDSFILPRPNLKDIVSDGQVLTIITSEPVRDRLGSRTRMTFRFADATAIGRMVEWKNQKPGAAAKAQGAPADANLQLQARHRHFPTGGCDGRLIITLDRLVYESVSEAGHSRRWELGQIKQIKRDGPYAIKIEPFGGGEYNIELQGKGLEDRDFRALVDRITAARAQK